MISFKVKRRKMAIIHYSK